VNRINCYIQLPSLLKGLLSIPECLEERFRELSGAENNQERVLELRLKRQIPSKEKAEIDSFDTNAFRMTMENFYIRQKIVRSVRKLLVEIEQK
jgi:hypothetical protein